MRGLRWLVVGLVALATIINYIDRQALGILWPDMSKELGLDKEDYENITQWFLIGYLIGKALFGKIMDAIGTRVGFMLAIVVWSVSMALHAVVRSMFAFSAVRFFMGLGEAGNWPGATKANAEWFPIKERALAQGIFNAGAATGAIVSAPVVGSLYFFFESWQATFVVLGALGFLWLVPWLIVYKSSPESHPWLSAEEREHILRGREVPREDAGASAATFAPGWWEMYRYRQSWAVIGSRFFIDPIWFLFIIWLPIYLNERFGFDVKQIALFAWVPYVGGAIGAVFGGWLAQHLLARGWSVNQARKCAIAFGGVLMFPALLGTAFAATPMLALSLMAVILFGFQVAIGNIQTLPSDFFSGKSVGSLAGVGGSAALLGSIITTEYIPDLTADGNYMPAFVLGALLVPLALLCVWALAPRIEPVPRKGYPSWLAKYARTIVQPARGFVRTTRNTRNNRRPK